MYSQKSFPPSATHSVVALTGVVAFLLSVAVIHEHLLPLNTPQAAFFIMGVTAAAIFLMDIIGHTLCGWQNTDPDTFRGGLSWSRSFYKLAGLLSTMAFIALLYWLFPEYHGSFYDRYYEMLRLVLPVWIILALPYIALVDCRMREPRDGHWYMGKLVTLQLSEVDWEVLWQHLLGWIIKGFFLPLMFIYFCDDIDSFSHAHYGSLGSFKSYYNFLYNGFYLIDVGLCCMGYLFALRLTGTHMRSAEPTMLGWVAALVCYDPFNSLFKNQYWNYENNYTWGAWLQHSPVLYELWGCVILMLTAIYAWATIAFGARFSNLTHRGIITNGPYRFTKHPAYIAKNISWWMVSVPFLATGSALGNLRHCLLLLLVNGIYWLRAKTEEWHLSRDPKYVAYAAAIRERGIFRFLNYVPRIFRSLGVCLPTVGQDRKVS